LKKYQYCSTGEIVPLHRYSKCNGQLMNQWF